MQVLKFGGTSVKSSDAIKRVIDIVSNALNKDRTVVVCSAISKCTDTLIEVGKRASERDLSYKELIDALQERHRQIIAEALRPEYQDNAHKTLDALFESLNSIANGVYLLGELSPASMNAIMSHGELMSTKIISAAFASAAIDNRWIDSREVVKTDDNGSVDVALTNANIASTLGKYPHSSLFIVPGFIASDLKGRTTTLGRGGSDYTASIFAVALKAREVQIWTDVPGMMTTNPKVVPTAKTIRNISYRAALELSHFGAKVIYPPTIQPVVAEGIPIYVKDTFHPEEAGTLIEKNPPRQQYDMIGISNSDNIALIRLEGSGMVGVPGFSSRLFDTLSRNGINIILITQASSVHTMCIAISEKDAPKAKAAADDCFAYEISIGKLNPLKVETGFSIVCLVGDDVLEHSGATGRMLAALGAHGIPVRATAQGSSERNISVIIPSDKVNDAIKHIHYEFFDKSTIQQVNLFIAGYGTIGKELVKIIAANREAICKRTNKNIHICGLANSRKYIIDTEGFDPDSAAELLENGTSAEADSYFEALANLSLENSIFVDCTASPDMGFKYLTLIQEGYSIVACNKIPFSGAFNRFDSLIKAAQVAGVNLRFETTVGAALPIIHTINRCINCGDAIHKVEAVLSGTLSYLFDKYDGGDFKALIAEAKAKGYTEPDPSIDLSGRDVLRKLLIISRLAGIPLEESDVRLTPVPSEEEVKRLYDEAKAENKKLKYVATIDADGRAEIGIKAIGPDNALYGLKGTDNAALITTDDYPSPMVIQGAGAGARQTAGGILNDILT